MALEGYKSNNNVVYSSKCHCVWTPRYRRPVLVGTNPKRWEQVIRQVAAKYQAEIVALEIMPDHVHRLVDGEPQFGIRRFIKNLEFVSSHTLQKEFRRLKSRLPTLWTNSYFVSTVGGAPLAVMKQYVEQQKNVEATQGVQIPNGADGTSV